MPSILIIDDDDVMLEVVKLALQVDGHAVETASDGLSGLSAIKHGQFDAVISDIVMPDMDGLQLLMETRRFDAGMKFIAMSSGGAAGDPVYLDVADTLGADAMLQKPFTTDDLRKNLSKVLGATH